jgi:hypothetical protein
MHDSMRARRARKLQGGARPSAATHGSLSTKASASERRGSACNYRPRCTRTPTACRPTQRCSRATPAPSSGSVPPQRRGAQTMCASLRSKRSAGRSPWTRGRRSCGCLRDATSLFAGDGRERISSAEVLRGVRYARDSMHHDWASALLVAEGGRHYPRTYPLVYFEWVWRPCDRLPQPDRTDNASVTVYRERLEGGAARATLHDLGGVFASLRSALEPHSQRKQPAS